MLIALVEFDVAPEDRAAALAALTAEAPEVRAMAGNLGFRPLIRADTPGGVMILHEWRDRAGFDAYRAGPGFAAIGRAIRPLMTATPVTRVFEAAIAAA